jgi:hypothetical protein
MPVGASPILVGARLTRVGAIAIPVGAGLTLAGASSMRAGARADSSAGCRHLGIAELPALPNLNRLACANH